MNKTQFRIGNIIKGSQYENIEDAKDDLQEDYSIENEWDFLKIESINHEGEEYPFYLECVRNGAQPLIEIWQRLQPVELTPELMTKLGWKYCEMEDDFASPNELIFWSEDLEGIVYCPTATDFYEIKAEIKYLHQLQNVVGILAGEEMDVSGLEK